ncbi:hypothetical protein FOZ62_029415, partial [Perkinsus olseni]
MHRIQQLDEEGGWHYDSQTGNLVKESVEGDRHERFSWSIASLGGPGRVEALRSFFRTLSEDKHVTLAIITRGNIGCVQLVLHNCGLLKYFTGGVFGNIGDRYGATEFDLSFNNDVSLSSLEGDEDHASWSRKTDVIRRLMGDKYEPNEAVFVEDDIKELRAAAKLCRGVYVSERRGMTDDNFQEILSLCKRVTYPIAKTIDERGGVAESEKVSTGARSAEFASKRAWKMTTAPLPGGRLLNMQERQLERSADTDSTISHLRELSVFPLLGREWPEILSIIEESIVPCVRFEKARRRGGLWEVEASLPAVLSEAIVNGMAAVGLQWASCP